MIACSIASGAMAMSATAAALSISDQCADDHHGGAQRPVRQPCSTAERASALEEELRANYTAIVGNPSPVGKAHTSRTSGSKTA
jgi:hypothetical protein